ncbi:hypothetical protein [Klebsiella phage Kpn74]|uniref:Uncharacterized protein n=1 Tax=Klebsiella phage Kpn74 TaxID=3044026 RepID=A0AAT9V5S9_9CAUD|nr:hypothetical protein [Klebsiella phage Kpn74]
MNKTPPSGGFYFSNGAKNMKTPLTYGAHRIIHDLFSKGAMFKGALSREKLPELEERGFVATSANNLVYLTPPARNMRLNPFW